MTGHSRMSTTSIGIEQTSPAGGWARSLLEAVRGLRYGSVEVVVHDGHVVQIERREKVRFEEERPPDHRRRNCNHSGQTDRNAGGTAPEDVQKETDP
jgi:hypothetical protein